MSRKGQEAARIGEHAREARQQAELREDLELGLDAVLRRGTTTRRRAGRGRGCRFLEAAGEAGEKVVVVGIDVVEDDLGQDAGGVDAVEVANEGLALREVADGVESAVGAKFLEAAGDVAEGAEVELLGPALAWSQRAN
ncbi:MAG: hypothetical protein U1G05_16125 [Kiritimatiellia bacterium]